MSEETDYWNTVEEKLQDFHHTSRVKLVDGEHDRVPGQRDIRRQEYRLYLKSSVVAKIEQEREESIENHSETLETLLTRLESEVNVVPGDFQGDSLFVVAEYDAYPGGSI